MAGFVVFFQPVYSSGGSSTLKDRMPRCAVHKQIDVGLHVGRFIPRIQEVIVEAKLCIEYLFNVWQQPGKFVEIAALQKIVPQG